MEEQTAFLPGSLQADPFETQLRGYHRRQVEDYLSRTRDQIAGLETRLAAALDEVERAHREVAVVREQYRDPAPRPAHEEISERMAQILRLATEEAEQKRTAAEQEIDRLRSAAQIEAEQRVSVARAEAEQTVTTARAEADRVLTSSRAQAEDELGRARAEARQLVEAAQAEASRTLEEARDHAERLRTQAERRAAVVDGRLTERVQALTQAHGGALDRLERIHTTLGQLLGSEAAAGPIRIDDEEPARTGEHGDLAAHPRTGPDAVPPGDADRTADPAEPADTAPDQAGSRGSGSRGAAPRKTGPSAAGPTAAGPGDVERGDAERADAGPGNAGPRDADPAAAEPGDAESGDGASEDGGPAAVTPAGPAVIDVTDPPRPRPAPRTGAPTLIDLTGPGAATAASVAAEGTGR